MRHSKIYISVGHFCNFEKWKRATMFAAFPNIHLRDGQSTADRPTARLLQKYCFMEASTEHDGVASPDGERANPFTSRLARINSSSRLSAMTNTFARTIRARAQSTRGKRVHHAFRELVLDPKFSCVGAKSALQRGGYRLGLYGQLASREATAGLAYDIYEFVQEHATFNGQFSTL